MKDRSRYDDPVKILFSVAAALCFVSLIIVAVIAREFTLFILGFCVFLTALYTAYKEVRRKYITPLAVYFMFLGDGIIIYSLLHLSNKVRNWAKVDWYLKYIVPITFILALAAHIVFVIRRRKAGKPCGHFLKKSFSRRNKASGDN